jgi:hypothetical protein
VAGAVEAVTAEAVGVGSKQKADVDKWNIKYEI